MNIQDVLEDFRKRVAVRAGQNNDETLLAIVDSLDETIKYVALIESMEGVE